MKRNISIGVVMMVIREDNAFLISQRRSKHGHGKWSAAGGHLEYGESFEMAAMRELHEEAGDSIIVSDPKLWTVTNSVYHEEEDRQSIAIFMCSRYLGGVPERAEPDKNWEWDWFLWHDIPFPRMDNLQALYEQNLDPPTFEELRRNNPF